jgi:hypothetical protein
MESSPHRGMQSDNCADESKTKSGLIQTQDVKKRRVTEESKSLAPDKWISVDVVTAHILSFLDVGKNRAPFATASFRVWYQSRRAESFPPVITLFRAHLFRFMYDNPHLRQQLPERIKNCLIKNPLKLVGRRTTQVIFDFADYAYIRTGLHPPAIIPNGELRNFQEVITISASLPIATIIGPTRKTIEDALLSLPNLMHGFGAKRIILKSQMSLYGFHPPAGTDTLELDGEQHLDPDGYAFPLRHLVVDAGPGRLTASVICDIVKSFRMVKELTIKNYSSFSGLMSLSAQTLVDETKFVVQLILQRKGASLLTYRLDNCTVTTFFLRGLQMTPVILDVTPDTVVYPLTAENFISVKMRNDRFGRVNAGPQSAHAWLVDNKIANDKESNFPYAGQRCVLRGIIL